MSFRVPLHAQISLGVHVGTAEDVGGLRAGSGVPIGRATGGRLNIHTRSCR